MFQTPDMRWLVGAIRGPWPGAVPGFGPVMDLQRVRASAFVSKKQGQRPEYCRTDSDGAIPQSSLAEEFTVETPFNCVHGLVIDKCVDVGSPCEWSTR